MRLNKVRALCKAAKSLILIDLPNGDQWIGDGQSAYAAPDLPAMEPVNVLGVFDVPEKMRESWRYRRMNAPDALCFDDSDESERPVESLGFYVMHHGKELLPVSTVRGLAFIERRYIEPLADMSETLTFYERRSESDRLYFAAKSGLILHAIIMPHFASEDFVEVLQRVARLGELAIINSKFNACGLDVDAETGEIAETA